MPIELIVLLCLCTAITATFILRLVMRMVSGKSPGLPYLAVFFVFSFVAQYITLSVVIGNAAG